MKQYFYDRANWLIKLGLWEHTFIEYGGEQGYEFKISKWGTLELYTHIHKKNVNGKIIRYVGGMHVH